VHSEQREDRLCPCRQRAGHRPSALTLLSKYSPGHSWPSTQHGGDSAETSAGQTRVSSGNASKYPEVKSLDFRWLGLVYSLVQPTATERLPALHYSPPLKLVPVFSKNRRLIPRGKSCPVLCQYSPQTFSLKVSKSFSKNPGEKKGTC
jgi:hypothetical protein